LKKVESLEVNKFLAVDWMGIISVTQSKKVFINKERSYKNVDTYKILKYLEKQAEDIFNKNKTHQLVLT